MKARSAARLVALGITCSAVASACDYFYSPFLNRIDAPVVVTGAQIAALQGANPATGVGYRWDASTSGWVQIPIQIDQRHVVAFGTTPPSNATPGVDGTVYGYVGGASPTALQYSDPNTFVGADPNPLFDADDELVFMARDSGSKAPTGTARPTATTGSGIQLTVTDPVSGSLGYVYLFRGIAGVDPSAGLDYVDYTFVLDSGNYATTYRRNDGPNPESSTVTTPGYTVGLDDRWFLTDLTIADGSGVDILDGIKNQFAINFCGRSNLTFANEEGAFVANIDGPVRAIRSYVGANSGPLTERTEFYYRDRFELVTDLRVHDIASVMTFVDFGPGAAGMSYRNSEMAASVVIDGTPDTVPTAMPSWSYATGSQGTLLSTATIESSVPLTVNNFYLDNATPPSPECWGDGVYRGANGAIISGGIPNTDPRTTPFATLQSHEYFMPMDPSVGAQAWAPVWQAAITADVSVTGTPF
jgi:hypothetical protein